MHPLIHPNGVLMHARATLCLHSVCAFLSCVLAWPDAVLLCAHAALCLPVHSWLVFAQGRAWGCHDAWYVCTRTIHHGLRFLQLAGSSLLLTTPSNLDLPSFPFACAYLLPFLPPRSPSQVRTMEIICPIRCAEHALFIAPKSSACALTPSLVAWTVSLSRYHMIQVS